jgi:electron transport complex protein RnfB
MKKTQEQKQDRRDFLRSCLRWSGLAGLAMVAARLFAGTMRSSVWQIDPRKCITCGNCETKCIKRVSAAKAVHIYSRCEYREDCPAYFLSRESRTLRCPLNAIKRTHIEGNIYEYVVDAELCTGCQRCVEVCKARGNGAMTMQIRHDQCLNCNECALARGCPKKAITRFPPQTPYIMEPVKS